MSKACAYQNQVTELLHLHASLEGELKLTSFDYNIREVQQVDLKRIYYRVLVTALTVKAS